MQFMQLAVWDYVDTYLHKCSELLSTVLCFLQVAIYQYIKYVSVCLVASNQIAVGL